MLGLGKVAKKVFGSPNDRIVKAHYKTVAVVNGLEAAFEKLSDIEVRAKTDEFRTRLGAGEKLNDILPAPVRARNIGISR